jgi:Zn finger protein HypA/HybF involved in hydrogenase expression
MIEKLICRPCDSQWEDDTEDEMYQQMHYCPFCGGKFVHLDGIRTEPVRIAEIDL